MAVDLAGRVSHLIPNKPIGYPLWDDWATLGRTSLLNNLVAQNCFNSRAKTNQNAVYIFDDGMTKGVGRGINIRFYRNHTIAGHIGIITGDYVPDDTDMEIAELISKTVSAFFSKPSGMISIEQQCQYITLLLQGDSISTDDHVFCPTLTPL